ncbi:antioxidant 1 copper chaperone [Leptinotarsa decemlineata]|uniref:antioxidant 1 copper chaperone n=1 Tax=Leptinotarsa decemlineata TaxID=7539 RepID=UPI000C252411|nr:metal homeostasis factor ATX1 [Leptinotarsa decemlineata]
MAKVHEFKVTMTCEGCSGAVERVLGKLKGQGVEKIDINLENQTVKVETSLPAEVILDVIKKTGKETVYVSSS